MVSKHAGLIEAGIVNHPDSERPGGGGIILRPVGLILHLHVQGESDAGCSAHRVISGGHPAKAAGLTGRDHGYHGLAF